MKKWLIFTVISLCFMLYCSVQAEEYNTSYPAKVIHKYAEFDNVDGLSGFKTLPALKTDEDGNTVAVFDSAVSVNVGMDMGKTIEKYADGGKFVMETKVKIDPSSIGARLYLMHTLVQIQGTNLNCANKSIRVEYGQWYEIKVILNYGTGYYEKFIVNGEEYDISSTQIPSATAFWVWTEPLASGKRIAYMDYYKIYNMDEIGIDDVTVSNGDVIESDTQNIKITYTKECDINTVDTAIILKKDNGDIVNTSFEYGSSNREIVVNIEDELEYGRNYILVSNGVKTSDGLLTSESEEVSFYTENQPLYTFNTDDANCIVIKNNWYKNRNVIFMICEYDNSYKLINTEIKTLNCEPQVESKLEIDAGDNTKIYVFDGGLQHGYAVLK